MSAYCPDKGDIVWLSFTPQTGHEQAGHRPAITLSPKAYNKKTGLGLFCPITSQIKNYPFEVCLPKSSKISGVILADQIKSLDWKSRKAKFHGKISQTTLGEVITKISVLLD